MVDVNEAQSVITDYPASIESNEIQSIAMGLMRYCTSDFLTTLTGHYSRNDAMLTSEYNFSEEFLALGCWVSDMHCFNHEAFASEERLSHALLKRQRGFCGMLELEGVYSLSSLTASGAEQEVKGVTETLMESYPVAVEEKHLIKRAGTGNESTNFHALLTWVERNIVSKKLNNEAYSARDFLLHYLSLVTEREEEMPEHEQVPSDVKIH